MRRPWIVSILLTVVGLGSLLLAAATVQRPVSFSLGVVPGAPVAEMRPDETLCQGPIDVVEDFDRVALKLGTFMRPGQPLDVRVHDARSHRTLGRGRLARGYADNSEQQVAVGRVREGRVIDVCVTNRGARRVVAYGNGGAAHAPSSATIDGQAQKVDAAIRFLRDRPRSLLSIAPRMVQRATLFAPSWLAPWMLWSLFALLAVGVPALLTRALTAAPEGSAAFARSAQPQAGAPVDP